MGHWISVTSPGDTQTFQFRIEMNYTKLWGWEVQIHNRGYSEQEYGGQGFLLDLYSLNR